jgi:sulfur transfer complex TusBCD TusB component (DsrH family)
MTRVYYLSRDVHARSTYDNISIHIVYYIIIYIV